MTRQNRNQRRDTETYRLRQQRKQQHRRDQVRGCKAWLIFKTKRAIKPLLMRQPRDHRERYKDASNGKPQQLYYVAFFVMTNFMCQHGFQFRLAQLCNECVKQYDFSKATEPGEEGVGVARTFAAIHHLDAARWKVGALRQCKEALAQGSFRQRCEPVEK